VTVVDYVEERAALTEGRVMAADEELAGRIRFALAGIGTVREVRMFGGLCFC